ncbi:MAG: IS30 family transposase, partial [Spirochaetaceae bacterium]|nr:IS30 family transposase [Spirochaetaceae bacterium]
LSGVTVESVTLDNGSEFSQFREIEKEQGAPVYFADPRSPGQRGTNERLNGRLRFWCPTGADFRLVAEERLRQVVDLVNNRPRKCLGWLSPVEFASNCCT